VKVWSLEPRSEVLTIPAVDTGLFALNVDGTKIASGSSNRLQVWNAQSGDLLFEQEANNGVLGIAFSADGKRIATGGRDQNINVWDAANGNILHTFPVEDRRIRTVTFDPTGNIVAAAGTGGMVQLFDLTNDQPLRSWNAGLGSIARIAFSPDGTQLAVSSFDKNVVKIFDPNTGEQVQELIERTGSNSSNTALAYSADGKSIITGGRDGIVRLWNVETGGLMRIFTGHTSTITTVRFSPDGTRFATASGDGTARIWDLTSGAQLLEVDASNAGVEFTPDGNRLVIVGKDGIQILALTMEELVSIAESRRTRFWTLEEQIRYLHFSFK
jgi:WD40 repeat protein